MKYLLDTNALLYYLYDNSKLTEKASDIIFDLDAEIFVSIASFWEIAIKSSIGKLEIKSSLVKIASTCEQEGFKLLQITPDQLDGIKNLPGIHGDPFDRLIIAQANLEDMAIVTSDQTISLYPVETCW